MISRSFFSVQAHKRGLSCQNSNCFAERRTYSRLGTTTRLNFKTSTATPNATAVVHREKPCIATFATSMASPAPSPFLAKCSPTHWPKFQPGDIFVCTGKGQFLGHAVLVVDVAVTRTGKRPFSSPRPPACDIHLIRNLKKPFRSPWFMTDGSEKRLLLSLTPFKATDLRHY